MKRFRVTYTDRLDPACPLFSSVVRAHDREHAIERFWDLGAPEDTDWRIVKIEEVTP